MQKMDCSALEYFFVEDRLAGSDVMGHSVFELGRPSEPDLLSRSFEQIIARHPLLNARIDRSQSPQLNWQTIKEKSLFFETRSFLKCFDSRGQIDIERHSGFKALAHFGDETTRIEIRFHHAACDGLAVISFFHEWMQAYRALKDGSSLSLPELDPHRLMMRSQARWRSPESVTTSKRIWNFLRHSLLWLKFRPIRILPGNFLQLQNTDHENHAAPCTIGMETGLKVADWHSSEFESILLDESETAALKATARAAGVMLNDLILSEFFILLKSSTCNMQGKNVFPIRVSLPNNLRIRGDQKTSASNILGFAFIDQFISARSGRNEILQTIGYQTREIRRWNGGQMFLDVLTYVLRAPRLLRWILRSDFCFASAIYSSVGQVGHIDPDLRFLIGKPPLRRNTNMALFTAMIGHRLAITLCTSSEVFSHADRRGILRHFLDRLCSRP